MLSHDSRALLTKRRAAGLAGYERYGVSEARELIAANAALTPDAIAERIALSERVSIAVHRPPDAADETRPTVIYIHGGGWVFGELPAHRLLCARLAEASGWQVISVDYRLAPEHPFPAALDDCFEALVWLDTNHDALDIDTGRIVLAGDSAGATLAATLAHRWDASALSCVGQVLIYPSVDQTGVYESHAIDEPGMAVTGRTMDWFRQHYFLSEDDRSDPLASPLADTPPDDLACSLVITAGYDPLRDEGERYVDVLRACGLACDHAHYPGELHGFLTVGPDFESSRDALVRIAAFLTSLSRHAK